MQVASDRPLSEVEALIARAAAHAGSAIVGLGHGWGTGSGFVLAPGRVVVPARRARGQPQVRFADGRDETGRVVGADADVGLAVLEADTGEAEPLRFADGDPSPAIGMAVLALANPGGRGLRTTLGFVSSDQRLFRVPGGGRPVAAIEHTAPLPQGSAGGPLLDAGGALVGINAARLPGGLILALAAGTTLRERLQALAAGRQSGHRRLGVAVAPPRLARRLRGAVGLPERDGLLVRAVQPGTPADRAGLRRGDLIVAAGQPLGSIDDLYAAIDALPPGEPLTLRVVRGTDERESRIEFPGGPEGPR